MIDHGKRSVLGVKVDVIDYEAAVERTLRVAKAREHFAVTALPVHGIMTGALDSVHRFRLNSFELLVPDGQPVRWALNVLHSAGLKARVYGPTLMLKLCERAALEDVPIYLYGSRTQTVDRLSRNLRIKFPRLRIAGAQEGRFRILTAREREELNQSISRSGASITFVGLGCPRQEIWAYENRPFIDMPLVCVGAAFDFHAGTVRQAPAVLQNMGLEWAFRLSREPKRLWRRYALYNPLYVGMVAAQASGVINFDSRAATPPPSDLNLG